MVRLPALTAPGRPARHGEGGGHADPNPAGPGVKVEDLAHRFAIERPSRVQPLALGSFARVAAAAALSLTGPLTGVALVWLCLRLQRAGLGADVTGTGPRSREARAEAVLPLNVRSVPFTAGR